MTFGEVVGLLSRIQISVTAALMFLEFVSGR